MSAEAYRQARLQSSKIGNPADILASMQSKVQTFWSSSLGGIKASYGAISHP